MKSMLIKACMAGLSVLAGCSGSGAGDEFDDPTATEQGAEVVATSGSRPLVMIVMNDCATCTLAHPYTWYRDKVFGPAKPNVLDYYKVVSRGRFQFTNAGLVFTPTNPGTAELDQRAGVGSGDADHVKAVKRAVTLAADTMARAGFGFRRWDSNGDGVVRNDELTIILVSNGATGGKTPSVCATSSDGVQFCGAVASVGDREQTLTAVHELGHTLGSYDVYGNWKSAVCHSSRATVMGCTPGSSDEWYNFDPWHRRKLGWVQNWATVPTGVVGTFALWSPRSSDGLFSNLKTEVVSIPNPANPKETIDFERRTRADNYDQNTAQSGIVAWYTLEHSNGLQLRQVPSLASNADGGDNAHFRLAPVNCVGDPLNSLSRGKANTLKLGSSYRFKWRDGTDTGYLYTVVADAADDSKISIARNSTAPTCTNP